jgi:hypothetical protein
MATIDVRCDQASDEGWDCEVTVRDLDRAVTNHRVHVRAADLARLAPGAATPTQLVESSFAFLLERESPGSILRSFDLMEIGRYFPEFESTIRERAS